MLSQWREYADRGAGVSIGISGEALRNMQLAMMRVQYDPKDQVRTMISMLIALYASEQNTGHKRGEDFETNCAMIASYALGFKSPAFSEEKEVRCAHFLSVMKEGQLLRLEDEDGFEGAPGQPVKYLTRANGGIVAHIDMPFPKDIQPIKQVWLGPKNLNPARAITYMMNGCGYRGYEIHRSAAAYR